MRTAIGLMSGTSMDGIDVALIKTDGEDRVDFGPCLAMDYPTAIRCQIENGLRDALEIDQRHDRPGDLAQLETLLTMQHVEALQRFLGENHIDPSEIDELGFHGQTVLHRPETGLTVQLGDGDLLARETSIDVIFDMRAADMELGGQGAPLVPIFHKALAAKIQADQPVCFVNIGGISNITYVDEASLIAFDSGPGNGLIDQWMQAKGGIPYDSGGSIASEGAVVAPIVDRYLAAPYFKKTGPKSLDRGDFPPLELHEAELSDGARTLAQVTAEAIYGSVELLPKRPRSWVLCGGGRLNQSIVSGLVELAAQDEATVLLSEDVGLQGDMLEAQAFAYLAVRSRKGLPLTFPDTTGCSQPAHAGVLARAR